MNTALFFARKMSSSKHYKNTVSARIIKIATLAVSLGMAAIIIALATSKGLQKEIQSKTSVFNGHILITLFENNESQVSLIPFSDSEELRNQIANEDNINRYHPIALKAGMLKTEADFEGVLFKGVTTDFDWSTLDPFLIQGEYPNLSKVFSNEILISETLARQLDLEVGDETLAFFQNQRKESFPNRRKFVISGIYFSGFPEIDQSLIYGAIGQVQRLNQWEKDQIGAYEIFVKDFSNTRQTADKLYSKLPSELNTIPIFDRFYSIFQWIALFDFNVLIILIVMILVGVINMATALLVLILERARMVGLIKALGGSNGLIQKIFLYNGILIMSKGLFFGNLIGLGFCYVQKTWGLIRLDPTNYFVEQAPVSISFHEIVILNIFFLVISSLLLWLPSKIILKISPSIVLRFR